jgi:hypothetical protein
MRTCLAALAALSVLSPATAMAADDEPGATPASKSGDAAAKPLDVSKLPFTEYSIKQVIKFHSPEIQTCYESVIAEMGKTPPEGKVYVSFSVLPTGLTSSVKVDKKQTTIKNDKVQECVTAAISAWEFPKPTDGREHPLAMPFSLKVSK